MAQASAAPVDELVRIFSCLRIACPPPAWIPGHIVRLYGIGNMDIEDGVVSWYYRPFLGCHLRLAAWDRPSYVVCSLDLLVQGSVLFGVSAAGVSSQKDPMILGLHQLPNN